MATRCKAAGVRYFRFHALRHLTASILDDLGVPTGIIQRILGHMNRRTTEICLHSVDGAKRDAENKLEGCGIFDTIPIPNNKTPTNVQVEYWI